MDWFGFLFDARLRLVLNRPMAKLTPSGKQSDAWKNAEREVAELFNRYGFTAERIIREDHGKSDFDVRIKELPDLVIDSKYRATFSHHSLFEKDLLNRYCKKNPQRRAIMPTKVYQQRGMYVTTTLEYLVELMALAYLKNRPVKGEWPCNHCGSACVALLNYVGNLHRYECPTCQLVVYSEFWAGDN